LTFSKKKDFLPNSVTDRSIEHSEETSIAKIATEEMNQEFDEFINFVRF